jgi:hypothetical protein
LTLLEKLDAVLICLEKHHKEKHHNFISIATILQSEQPEINFGEITFILNKLKKDGFIDTQEIPIPTTDSTEIYYNINYEGRIWDEQGGYTNQKTQDLLSRANQKVLVFLTWIIAIATAVAAVYYGIEVWKHLHRCT